LDEVVARLPFAVGLPKDGGSSRMNRRRTFFLALLTVSLAAFGACDNEPVSKATPAGYVPTYDADYYADPDAGEEAATGEDSGEGDAGEDATGSQGDDGASDDSASPGSDDSSSPGSGDGGSDAAG
jgi:hypothetical protein